MESYLKCLRRLARQSSLRAVAVSGNIRDRGVRMREIAVKWIFLRKWP